MPVSRTEPLYDFKRLYVFFGPFLTSTCMVILNWCYELHEGSSKIVLSFDFDIFMCGAMTAWGWDNNDFILLINDLWLSLNKQLLFAASNISSIFFLSFLWWQLCWLIFYLKEDKKNQTVPKHLNKLQQFWAKILGVGGIKNSPEVVFAPFTYCFQHTIIWTRPS